MSKLGNLLPVTRLDTWYNALTGLGNALRDKLQSSQFIASYRLTDAQLESLYHDDDMAARIVEALPEEAMRKGYYLSIENEEDSDSPGLLVEYEKRLGFRSVFEEAAVWGRLYGGAAVYLGIDDGQSEDLPVNFERIKSIRFATVLTKKELTPLTWYDDPLEDINFGEPEVYQIRTTPVTPGSGAQRVGAKIHESRLLLFDGARTTLARRLTNEGWHDSVLQKVNEVLMQFSMSWQAVAHLMQDASQGVFKVEGLIDMIAAGSKDLLQSRMELVDMSRSVARAIMVDAGRESFERQTYSFTGVPDVLRVFMLRLAAAARMPVTVLMGQSPAGMNATGENDTRMWYDRVQAYQSNMLGPQIERFWTLVFAAKDFPGELPDNWEVKWERLWQLTDKEQAELEKTTAEKDKVYIDAQVVLPEEVALNRFKARGFSTETQIDMGARREMLKAEIDLAREQAGEPPPAPPALGQTVEPAEETTNPEV